MYCPMSFANEGSFRNGAQECTSDCAWAIKEEDHYSCAMSILAVFTQVAAVEEGTMHIRAKSLEDDAE